jgi:hypothetical protein
MKSILLSLLLLPLAAFAADVSASHDNPPPKAVSADKPEYLHFKKGTFTRIGKNRIDVEIELAGELPNNMSDDKVSFAIGFDIDNQASTGTESISFPGLGKDISISIYKPVGTNKFTWDSGSVVLKNRSLSIEVSKLKVRDGRISCELQSPLFGEYPSLRLYVLSKLTKGKGGMVSSQTSVDQLPRNGALTLSSN